MYSYYMLNIKMHSIYKPEDFSWSIIRSVSRSTKGQTGIQTSMAGFISYSDPLQQSLISGPQERSHERCVFCSAAWSSAVVPLKA